MLKLRSESKAPEPVAPPRRPQPWRLYLLLLVLTPMVALGIARWRGKTVLRKWKYDGIAKGEILDPRLLWPAPSAHGREFSNELAMALGQIAPGMKYYSGELLPLVSDDSGKFRRGSQEPQPAFYDHCRHTNTWQDLYKEVRESQAGLSFLRDLMQDPPPDQGYDVVRQMETGEIPNFVNVRVSAQSLQTAALLEIHQGNLPVALADLRALLAFEKLYDRDPGMISYMIRMAITGLSVDICCDALQADGWTEPQLAALQQATSDSTALLAQMPRTTEAVALEHLQEMESFRSQSYQSWYNHNQQAFKNFGATPEPDAFQKWIQANAKLPVVAFYEKICTKLGSKSPGDIVAPWRQWLIHPMWSFAWADQEELEYLQNQQAEMKFVREAVQHRSFLRLKQQLLAFHEGYHPPAASWRFYGKLPMQIEWAAMPRDPNSPEPAYPYTDFSRTWLHCMKNLTLNEMMVTAIAVKRFELKHGQPPATLADLMPDYLGKLPTDFMDGQPLHYFPNADGTFTLYSAGDKPDTDASAGASSSPANPGQNDSPWDRRYWVWPQILPQASRSLVTLQAR